MAQTKTQGNQALNDAALPILGKPARTEQKDVNAAIDTMFDAPLRMYAAATPDSKLYFTASEVSNPDGTSKSAPAIKSSIPIVPATTIDFQTGAVVGGSVDITFPTSTLNFYRRVGFTLISGNKIQALFGAEAATLGALPDPGALFVKGGTALGWVDLQCTNIVGRFKTADSLTNVIENAVSGVVKIHRFGAGTGSGSGSGTGGAAKKPADGFVWLSYDTFDTFPTDAESKINNTLTTAAYSTVNELYEMKCDKTRLVTTTGVNYTLNGAPSFPLTPGCIIWNNVQATWRKVATVLTATTGTLDAAFPVNAASQGCMVAQAVYTKDLVNFGTPAELNRPRDAWPNRAVDEIHVEYSDSLIVNDAVADAVQAARVVASACNAGGQSDVSTPLSNLFSPIYARPALPASVPNYPLTATPAASNFEVVTGARVSGIAFVSTRQQAAQFTIAQEKVVVSITHSFTLSGVALTQNVTFKLIKDNGAGLPSTNVADVMASLVVSAATITALGAGTLKSFTWTLPTPTAIPAGTYHAVVTVPADQAQLQFDVGSFAAGRYALSNNDGVSWTEQAGASPYLTVNGYDPTNRLLLAYFPNPNNSSVTAQANLLDFDTSFYKDATYKTGGLLNSAFCMTDSSGTSSNATVITTVGSLLRVELGFDYVTGLLPNLPDGDLEVFVEGQKIPRFYTGVVGAHWKEVVGSSRQVELWADLHASSLSLHFIRRQGSVDTADQNAVRLAAYYDAIVGSTTDVAAGRATHSSWQAAHDAAIAGAQILILPGFYVENVVITKAITFQGKGRATELVGTFTCTATGFIGEQFRVNGAITLNGSYNFLDRIWLAPGMAWSEGGTDNDFNVTQEV